MLIGKGDIIAIGGAVVASLSFFLMHVVTVSKNTNIPKCIPWNRTYVLGIGNSEDRENGVFGVTDRAIFMSINSSMESMKVIVDKKARKCEWSDSDQLFRCETGENVLDLIIDSLSSESVINESSLFSGAVACKMVKEIARVLNVTQGNGQEHWISLYPKLRKMYDEFMDGYKPKLNSDELLAIFMPLLMPLTVLFLRVLKMKRRM